MYDSPIQMQPTNSIHRSKIESADNDFYLLKCYIYSGFYLDFRPKVDLVVQPPCHATLDFAPKLIWL